MIILVHVKCDSVFKKSPIHILELLPEVLCVIQAIQNRITALKEKQLLPQQWKMSKASELLRGPVFAH